MNSLGILCKHPPAGFIGFMPKIQLPLLPSEVDLRCPSDSVKFWSNFGGFVPGGRYECNLTPARGSVGSSVHFGLWGLHSAFWPFFDGSKFKPSYCFKFSYNFIYAAGDE